jgi:acyl-CoA synthetase (AMP-forming)/AMP-acid ligase II/pimeloyl-ACP methyl ester carboxylesterase
VSAPALPTDDQFRRWGVDPGWSQRVAVTDSQGATTSWHVLDRTPVRPLATLVCVHGNPTWSYLWHHLVARLGDRYRVVAVDQIGMGYSDRGRPRRYAERVIDLGDVMRALDIEGPVVAVGHDWGGAIALGWAVSGRASDAQLAGVVLCNTGIAVPAGRSAPWLIRLAASGPITGLVGHQSRTFVDATIGLSFAHLSAPVREALRAPYRHAADRQAIAEFVKDVPFTPEHPSSAAIAEVAERIHTITAPTLLTWGATDPVFDDSFALDLAARIPHADRHRFTRAGHLSPLEVDVAGVVDAWVTEQFGTPRTRPTVDASPSAAGTVAGAAVAPTWSALEARAHDDETAFTDGVTGARISFAELYRRVMAIAAGLGAIGVRPGDRIALLVPPSIDLVASVYACWRAGAVTVIADRGLGLRGLGRAVRGAHVDWVIGPPQALAAARSMHWAPRARTIAVGAKPVLGAVACLDQLAQSTAALPTAPHSDDLAAVLYTSGATGPAKGVRYRHRQIAAQRDALAKTYGITVNDRLVAAFAPFALYGPALGIASTIPDVDVTKPGALTASALGAACAEVDATVVFASPAALANVNRTAEGPDARFAPVRLVLSAGAPVPIATLRATATLFPAAQLHTPYGMTECLPVADVSLHEIDDAGSGAGVCVGHPVDGVEVLVAPLDFEASAGVAGLGVGATGEVLVRTPWLSDGYDQLWRTEHDARPRDRTGAVWHRTGDVGHLDAIGRLWIEGRSIHVIHTVDGPVTSVPVEVSVETLDGVERAAAVGIGPDGCQQLVVVVEDAAGADGLATEALSTLVRDVVAVPVAAVLTATSMPVDIRHNTKIDRAVVAAWATQVLSGAKAKRTW